MLPVLILAAVAALLLSPGLISGPSLDAAVFTYAAERVTEGARLYADVWDHKPPGVYLVYAVFQFVLPFLSPWLVTWLLSVLVTALTGATVMAAVLRMGVSPGAALFAAVGVVGAMAQYLTALGGGLTEPLATLPLTVALLISVSAHMTWVRAFLVGLLVGSSLLSSVIALPGAVAIAVLVPRAKGGPGRPLRVLAGIAGAAAPVMFVAAMLAAVAALDDALDAVIGYAAAYRASSETFGAALSGPVVAWTLLALLFLLVPAAYGVAHGIRDHRRRESTISCLLWVGLALAMFPLQGRFLAHYAIPLAMPLGVLASFGLDRLLAARGRVRFAPLAVALVISVVAGIASGLMEWESVRRDRERVSSVSADIRRLTDADERIFVWGNSPQLYLESERSTGSSYSYLYPLTTPGYSTDAQVDALVADFHAEPPRLVIDAGSPEPGAGGFLPLLVDRPVGTDGRTLDLLDPIRDFVRANYAEVTRDSGWIVYALVTEPG